MERHLLKMIPNHKSEIDKIFRRILRLNGLSGRILANKSLKHVIVHGYRKVEHHVCVQGRLYCRELSDLLPKVQMLPNQSSYESSTWEWNIYEYSAGSLIGRDKILQIDDDLDLVAVEKYFNEMISKAVAPLVLSVQTPRDAVNYAIHNRRVIQASTERKNEILAIWSAHFGLDFSAD